MLKQFHFFAPFIPSSTFLISVYSFKIPLICSSLHHFCACMQAMAEDNLLFTIS
jgi:hypothetical protein